MADVNGLVSDPIFQKLDPASQRQALLRVTGDQSFSNLSDGDTQQFVSRLSKGNGSEGLGEGPTPPGTAPYPTVGSPSAMRRGEPILKRNQTQAQRDEHASEAPYIGAGAMALSAAAPLIAGGAEAIAAGSVKPLIQAAVPYATSYMGSEAGKKIGGVPGQIIGGLAGAMAPGAFRPLASRYMTPDSVDTLFGPSPYQKATPIKSSPNFTGDAADAYNAGRQGLDAPAPAPVKPLPSTFTLTADRPLQNVAGIPSQPALTPVQQLATAQASVPEGIRGSLAKPSGRLVQTPEEFASKDRMQDLAKTRASENGMMYAAGMRPGGGGRVPMTATATENFEYPGARTDYDVPVDTAGDLQRVLNDPNATSSDKAMALASLKRNGHFAKTVLDPYSPTR